MGFVGNYAPYGLSPQIDGMPVIHKKDQKALLVSNEELADALVEKMLKAGNQTYENINDAYADTGGLDAKSS